MEQIHIAKEKIDLLLDLFQVDHLNETGESAIVNKSNLDFDFEQARALIKEAEIDLNILWVHLSSGANIEVET